MKTSGMSHAQRIRLEYFDQNDAFAPFLPRTGEVVGRRMAAVGSEEWLVLKLDEPFDYQLPIDTYLAFRFVHVGHLLIRSRWAGYSIGGPEPTSVFILLVDGDTQVPDQFDPKLYPHFAWGPCKVEHDV